MVFASIREHAEHSFKFCEQLTILMDHSSPLPVNPAQACET